MQTTSGEVAAENTNDFAGLLAALTAAKPTELPAWNEDEPTPDITTLSYERTLRTHARYRSASNDALEMRDLQPMRPCADLHREMRSQSRDNAKFAPGEIPADGSGRKCASVTIRMSKAECDQLRARAAEAGLTISGYLRSCTFEAESLRTQVKEALAEMRNQRTAQSEQDSERARPVAVAESRTAEGGKENSTGATKRSWLRSLIPDLHPPRRLVRA